MRIRSLSVVLALCALGVSACGPGTSLGLKMAEQKDATALEVNNQTPKTLHYSDEILALVKRRDGDFYLLVKDSNLPVRPCGVIDTPIPKLQQVASGSKAIFKLPPLSSLYCLKVGQSYTLTIQYRPQLDNLEAGPIMFESNSVRFVAQTP